MRVHVGIDPWAHLCHVLLNGYDISHWCVGADDERNTVAVSWPLNLGTKREEREIPVDGELEIVGVEDARQRYRQFQEERRERSRIRIA